MASIKRQFTLRELRTALNVLSKIDSPVPESLLVELSDRIREKESKRLSRRLNRMSEEELIRFDSRQRSSLRIVLADGRLLHCRTNDETFHLAMLEVGAERLCQISYSIRHNSFVQVDSTATRRRIRNYTLLQPGLFFYNHTTAVEKCAILQHIDSQFQMGWDISVV